MQSSHQSRTEVQPPIVQAPIFIVALFDLNKSLLVVDHVKATAMLPFQLNELDVIDMEAAWLCIVNA